LLSYRLYEEFNGSDHSWKQNLLSIVSYFTKRFFRIYIPFVVTVLIYVKCQETVKFHYKYNTFWNLLTFNEFGPIQNHLWTIAPEVQYYMFVPFFTYSVYKLPRFFYLILFASSIGVVYDDMYFFQYSRFRKSLFFKASILALLMHKVDRFELFTRLKSHPVFRSLIGLSALGLFYIMIRKFAKVYNPKMNRVIGCVASENYSICLFTLVCIGAPNFLTESLNGSVWKKLGKYSFGIYLFHPLCIDLVRYQLAITSKKQVKKLTYVGTILDIEVFGLVFFYSYICGFVFHYLIERNCIEIGSRICKNISVYIFSSDIKNGLLIPKFCD
jgi:peptidoglycan/LPS O-acetylase OafA/YrhL